jgi:hypothetical protein
MMHNRQTGFLMAASTLVFLSACSNSSDPAATQQESAPASASDKPAATLPTGSSPGKPSAPINFRYAVQGTPVVGQPVAINIFVTSSVTDAPINLYYRVNDASSMSFPASQALRTEFTVAPGDQPRAQQVTVIPQREGRLYLNVSAEIETATGTMLKTTSIPIQVGSAPPELETNGALIETEEGETVLSMPASQSD